jgi:hypothetical protein
VWDGIEPKYLVAPFYSLSDDLRYFDKQAIQLRALTQTGCIARGGLLALKGDALSKRIAADATRHDSGLNKARYHRGQNKGKSRGTVAAIRCNFHRTFVHTLSDR